MNPFWLEDIVRSALVEDIGRGDRTAEATAPKSAPAEGRIIAKSAGRIAGIDAARLAFQLLDPAVEFTGVEDGADVDAGQEVASVRGPARALLTAERTALNFLQRLSGIATAAAAAVEAAKPYGAKIVDTRKTTPGLRQLEKHAVRMGGGFNHRHGLDDAILIKENHIAIAGGLEAAVTAARSRAGHLLPIEVEVENLDQLEEALALGVRFILLDNFTTAEMKRAVEMAKGRAVLEASGGITLEQVAEVAETGVDVISLGGLTHSAPALDLSLQLRPIGKR